MPEKNANYCYSYLSRKVCHNEAASTLHLGDTACPKQLDELYPMDTPTVSTEGVGIDVTNEYPIRCMLDNIETGFCSEKSVCQQNFGLKNMLAYPTSSLAYLFWRHLRPHPQLRLLVYPLDRAHRVVSEKLCLRDGEYLQPRCGMLS